MYMFQLQQDLAPHLEGHLGADMEPSAHYLELMTLYTGSSEGPARQLLENIHYSKNLELSRIVFSNDTLIYYSYRITTKIHSFYTTITK